MPSTPLKLARFDPSPFGFPRPKVPLLATRSAAAYPGGQSSEVSADGNRFRSFTRGRYALHEAYRLSGIGQGATLMAPAYHCVTMLDPAIALGGDVLLYPLKPDLSPDLESLDSVFAAAGSPVRALLATHFFGLAQDFARLKAWCDARRIVLVEDCSHVFFTETFRAPGTGSFGEYVTSSPYKFLACEDGGLLYAADGSLLGGFTTDPPGLIEEIRGFKRALEKRWAPGSLPSVGQSLEQLSAITHSPAPVTKLHYSEYLRPSPFYDASESGKTALRWSRRTVRTSAIEPIARQRRQNYERWMEAVSSLPNCHALYSLLPDGCVPYMFPLLIDHPDPHFFRLKQLGMPVWRWDEMAISDCAVSKHCQLHLLHLPCHQSLGAPQLEWMIGILSAVMRLAGEGKH